MGRPITQRQPVRRAILEVLVSGPVLARDALAEVMRRTGAARQTIDRHGRELYAIESRRTPGERTPTRWWSLWPEVMTTDPEILITAPEDPTKPEVMTTAKRTRGSSRTGRGSTRKGVHGRASKGAEEGSPSLLDGDQRHEEPKQRAVVLNAFGESLVVSGRPLSAVTGTTTTDSSGAHIAPRLADRVSTWGGGIWLVPQAGDATTHEHYHGVLMGVSPKDVIQAWLELANGTAAHEGQWAKDVDGVSGWLNYCRREPGFDLGRVVVSGLLRAPWAWALGHARLPIPTSWWANDANDGPLDGVMLADLTALRRTVLGCGSLGRTPHAGFHPSPDPGPT